ncbi:MULTISPECIES: DUF805 domain-containing protein [unclassified Motilimonas]|uniref:DUF805 domain-containing protein n=1 Tax=Motilimonas TaxID=1914248 RepID=UPI001E5DC211|nr:MULTISPECIES: DUF805 domain-containing protein [unclassified Motilimonas]MCE0557739.1 DUF805 domain-containing protein [Motilimonas sp. E26]MDO6525950.1 DUF805 domain-containing protein [Motilimonas sp. 1_MG-2023]
MNWYKLCWAKYATFEGRARRSEYWFFQLFNFIAIIALGVVCGILDGVLGTSGLITGVVLGVYCLASLLPAISVTVRRLHDIGKSGWWFWVSLIPGVGGIILLIFTIMDSAEANDFGANPKLATA